MKRVSSGAVALALLALGCAAIAISPPVTFVDVAPSSGLTVANTFGGKMRKDYILETTGNGVAIFDYDRDGAEDIFVVNGTTLGESSPGRHLPQLYHNDGHGHFTDVAAPAGFTTEGWGQGVCVGDYDNDGWPDLLVTYYGHNRLYRNQGDGTFRDVTAQAKLPVDGLRFGSGCSFLDYDRDGLLDLFVANYVDLDLSKTPKPGDGAFCLWKEIPVMCGPRGLPPAHNILYHNNGNGTFTDVSEKAGILRPGGRYSLGVAAADFSNDGWPDIYVACDMTPSLLFRNKHDGTFEERGVAAGVAYNFDGNLQAGMGVAVADFDGDGMLDIAKTNFSGDLTSLFRNEDGKFFTDVSRSAGLGSRQFLGWGIAFVDVDDDGWEDLVIANGHVYPEVENKPIGDQYLQPTLLFRNLGNGRFVELGAAAGPAFEVPRPARGLAVGDLDGDGRQEIVIVNMNSTPSLLHNRIRGGNFLNVGVSGTKSNRSGIGARIIVTAGGRKRVSEVMSGASYYSNNSLVSHFGLGGISTVDALEIRWPSGLVQKWSTLAVNQKVIATEGADELKRIRQP
ncbi:MAG TPA: CRTAC1 family protein [Bryobacteraceae bacterium]|nr:CRTAC1 family protein [Bryobacteraceae bacterium]